MRSIVILIAISFTGLCPASETGKQQLLKNISDFSLDGMNRRLGPEYDFFHKTIKLPDPPLIWLRPDKEIKGKRSYQVGGEWKKDAGDYSSTQGQIVYFPDQGPGVDRVSIHQSDHGYFCQKPEAPWNSGFRPEPSVAQWQKSGGKALGVPLGMARGLSTWSNCGVIVFSSGFVGTAGTVTASGGHPSLTLPPEKLPVAITVTPRNEFALITVCDTKKMMAQIAVIALTGGGVKSFVHDWPDSHPCLANVGFLTGMKLLGFVDLPGIVAPTGICSVGNNIPGRLNGPDGNAGMLRSFDLSRPGDRNSFYKSGNETYTNSAGFAIVTARYENKACFVDLQPLFQHVREMYFTSDENYKKTRDQGPAPEQWPVTFEKDPSWMPKLVTTIDVKEPTAATATFTGGEKARAFIASMDGTVGIYAVGGLATDAAALPNQIGKVGEFKLGKNPVCLTHQKGSHDSFLAVSRGDREIEWFKLTGDTATVTRRLRDKRMIDPVDVEVADTHGIETNFITVADFKGKKIINYRCSPINFATQGGMKFPVGEDGKADFECGGTMDFPGYPFCVSATNVN